MNTQLYHISQGFARHNNLPVYFVANKLTETNKAVYLFGRGTTQTTKMGVCMNCGRTLTHPVSVELGIGPECGKHYWDWDAVGGYSKENIARLTQAIKEDIKIDSWLPKSVIKEVTDTNENVNTPSTHKMASPKRTSTPSKKATLVQYQNSGLPAIKIEFPFDPTTVSRVKTIPGRKFHNEGRHNKYWTAPRSIEAVEKLLDFGFDVDPKLIQYLDQNKVSTEDMDADIDIPGLGGELFPFQKKGVAFIEARDGRALVADEMGLGKTVQALAWLQKHPEKRPAVIVCPSSLKLNWAKETERWVQDPNIQILNGTKASEPIVGEIIIINYHILKDWKGKLKDIKPQVLIPDEVHYAKNNKAKRTKALKDIAKQVPHVIALTGTPIVNRPQEILNAIQMVDKSVAPNSWHFLQRYCDAKKNGFGWDFSGASNTEELHEKLTNSIMVRRKKKDVLTELPDKLRSFVPMELDNESEYRSAEADFIEFVRRQKGYLAAEKASNAQALAEVNGLTQLATRGKLNHAVSWIRDFLDNGGKLVVMAVHKFVISRLMEEFGEQAVKVDGSVSGEGREEAVERFQNDNSVRLFIGNIKAAGVGLTLTSASAMAFLELPWTPGDVSQAEDRIHRIGQTDKCHYYYLLAEDTIEERRAAIIDKKRKILDSVLDGTAPEQDSLLSELMSQYQ